MAGAAAGMAGRINHLAGAMAAVASARRLHHTEGRTLAHAHLSGAVALGAGLGAGALLRAGAAAFLAVLDSIVGNRLFAALRGLLKVDVDHGLGVAAAARGVRIGTARAAAESAEEAVKDIAKIYVAGEGAAARRTAAEVRVHARVAELIVAGLLLLVGEDLIRLVQLLELGFGVLVAGMQIGVILLRQLTVCLFDFILRRIAGDAHDLIIISLIRQSNHS